VGGERGDVGRGKQIGDIRTLAQKVNPIADAGGVDPLDEAGIGRVDAGAGEDEPHVLALARQDPGGLDEALMILHRVESREHRHHDRLGPCAERRPRALAHRGVTRERGHFDAVRDDSRALGVEAFGFVLAGGVIGVVDDRRRAVRPARVPADDHPGQRRAVLEIAQPLAHAPHEHRAAHARPRGPGRREVPAIHPALYGVGCERAREPRQPPGGTDDAVAGLHDLDPSGGDRLGQRLVTAQGRHGTNMASRRQAACEAREKPLGAAARETGGHEEKAFARHATAPFESTVSVARHIASAE
jgi:hypothetical protein